MSPFSRRAAQRNKKYLNRLMRPLARVMPGLALLTHTGRNSGHRYTVPVLIFVRRRRYVVALTYGREADWVRNVHASGRAELQIRTRRIHLRGPQVHHDPTHRWAPPPLRIILRRIQADELLSFVAAHPVPRGRSRRPLPPPAPDQPSGAHTTGPSSS